MYLVFVQMLEAFGMTSSIYSKERLEIFKLGVVVRSNLFIERNSGTTGNVKGNRECAKRWRPVAPYLKASIISSSFLSIASKSWRRDCSRPEYRLPILVNR
jgi:hypothetical protein